MRRNLSLQYKFLPCCVFRYRWLAVTKTEPIVSNYVPLAYTVAEPVKATGLTRTRLYSLAAEGKLNFRRAGRRTVILSSDLQQLLAALPPAPIRPKNAA